VEVVVACTIIPCSHLGHHATQLTMGVGIQ